MAKFLYVAVASLISTAAVAKPIEVNGPFYRQLVAMGYTLEESDEWTFARRGGVTITATRDEKYTWIGRFFFAKSKSSIDPKLLSEALDAINSANSEFAFTTTLNDDSLICGIHLFGEYSPSTYGIALSEIEKCNFIYDKFPTLLKLQP
jgi:hypothetical protein